MALRPEPDHEPEPIPVASFCSGVGMLDVGLHAALELVGRLPVPVVYVEREAYAAAVLVARMEEKALGQAPLWDDIKTFPGPVFRRAMAGGIAVAGLPCQGYSLAGRRLILDDPRNLWPWMRQHLRDMGCEWFFLENVHGFLSPERSRGLAAGVTRVLGDLAEDGWDAEWTVLPAGRSGSPHRRNRVFLLARSGGGMVDPPGPRRHRQAQPAGHHGGQALLPARPHLPVDPVAPEQGRPLFAPRRTVSLAELRRELSRNWTDARRRDRILAELRCWRDWQAVAAVDPSLMPCREREVRGVDDGLAPGLGGRADSLRAVGNGVVPLAAAVAFVLLHGRIVGWWD